MKRQIGNFISFLFHPVVLSLTAPFLVVYKQSDSVLYAFKWVLFSSFFLFLAMFILFLLWPGDFFVDFDITRRRRRMIFYAVTCGISLLYFIIAVIFKSLFF